jgi:hypothetical protein
VYVNYLRRKLQDPPPGRLIRTVRGQGYMVPSEADLALSASLVLGAPAVLAELPTIPAASGPTVNVH